VRSHTIGAGSELITCERLADLLKKDRGRVFLLDVREPDEYREGWVPGSVNIPLGRLAGRAGELPRDEVIVCVCRSGSRSLRAARWLRRHGVRAISLEGGVTGWKRRTRGQA
jgi:rhodanese-related sulfurtransferase